MKLPNMTLRPNCIPLRSTQSGELGRYPTFDCFDPYCSKVKTSDLKYLNDEYKMN